MIEYFGLDLNLAFFYVIPIIVFGPVFVLVMYHLGLKEIFNPTPETKERRRKFRDSEKVRKANRLSKLKAAGLDRSGLMRSPSQWLGQAVTFTLFALVVAWFSNSPVYVAYDPDRAMIKLSLTHPGQRKEACRKLSPAELKELAANMRSAVSCPRQRWPLIAELSIDGELIYHGTANPVGLARSGHSSFYEKFPLSVGLHRVVFRLNDRGGEGYNYVVEKEIEVKAAQIIVVSFDNSSRRPTIGE